MLRDRFFRQHGNNMHERHHSVPTAGICLLGRAASLCKKKKKKKKKSCPVVRDTPSGQSGNIVQKKKKKAIYSPVTKATSSKQSGNIVQQSL